MRLSEPARWRLVFHPVLVSNQAYELESRVAPRPRLEIWAGDGRLLLLRSVPPVVDEEALIAEIRWARAFTAPLGEDGSR